MWGERREERGDTDQYESLGADGDGGHAEHRVERAVDVRHELLVLVPEQRSAHAARDSRPQYTRAFLHHSYEYTVWEHD